MDHVASLSKFVTIPAEVVEKWAVMKRIPEPLCDQL